MPGFRPVLFCSAFWVAGVDALLRAPSDAAAEQRAAFRRGSGPTVFVYDLPGAQGGEVLRDDVECEGKEPGSAEELSCLFGRVLDLGEAGAMVGGRVRDVDQFSLGRVMLASLRRHPNRVASAEEADLFFIPVFRTWGWPDNCVDAEALVKRLDHLDEHNAPRHIMVSPRVGWHVDVCEHFESRPDGATLSERLLANVTKLALESDESVPHGGWYTDLIPRATNLHSVPYPGMNSALSGVQVDDSHTERPYLVSAVWSVHKYVPTEGRDVRRRLTKQCAGDDRCLHVDLHGLEDPAEGTLSEADTEARSKAVVFAMLNSTFCFETTGDTTSRKGMVDAIVLGCIPVLFSPLQQQLWPWHVDDWQSVSVLVSPDEEDVISRLAAIPESEVKRLRWNLQKLAPQLGYAAPGSQAEGPGGDALAATLRGIWRTAAAISGG